MGHCYIKELWNVTAYVPINFIHLRKSYQNYKVCIFVAIFLISIHTKNCFSLLLLMNKISDFGVNIEKFWAPVFQFRSKCSHAHEGMYAIQNWNTAYEVFKCLQSRAFGRQYLYSRNRTDLVRKIQIFINFFMDFLLGFWH